MNGELPMPSPLLGQQADSSGFPKGALNKAYDECKNTLDGQVTSCPYFQKSIQAEPARDCTVQGNIINEVSSDTLRR